MMYHPFTGETQWIRTLGGLGCQACMIKWNVSNNMMNVDDDHDDDVNLCQQHRKPDNNCKTETVVSSHITRFTYCTVQMACKLPVSL